MQILQLLTDHAVSTGYQTITQQTVTQHIYEALY